MVSGPEDPGAKRSLKEWNQQRINLSIYGKVILAKEIDNMTSNFRENFDSQCQTTFTMESLILAQDER